MQINLAGWQKLNRVWFFWGGGREGRDRRRANSGNREERERKEHVRRRGGVRCSHSQAHSSCIACWDALGSVLHNTITACSGVFCSAPLCSDYLLLGFFSVLAMLPSLPVCMGVCFFFFFLIPLCFSIFCACAVEHFIFLFVCCWLSHH